MKILWVFNHPAPYKVRVFNELAKHLDLDVFFERTKAKNRPDNFYYVNEYNFSVHFGKKGYFGNENCCSSELKKYIANNYKKYDLIIMNGFSKISEIKAIRYMNKKHIGFAFYINGGIAHKESGFKRRFKRKLLKNVQYAFSPAIEADSYLKQYLPDDCHIYHYPYSTILDKEVIPYPLDSKEKRLIREEYNLPLDKRIFVNSSQFIERKNNIQLMTIFKDVDAHLLLIGSGELENEYKRYIQDNNFKNVTLMPFKAKDELLKILRGCDFHITLSKEDIYGHTINEAFANGLPVIASNKIIGAKHLIIENENGYLVSLDDEEQIKTAISKIDVNMAEVAIKTAKENTIEKSIEVHLNIFKEIMK